MKTRLILTALGFWSLTAWAGPQSFNVGGTLLDATNTPITDSAVQFNIEVEEPVSGCILWGESQTKNMTNSNGEFSIDFNDGTGSRFDSSGITSLATVFQTANPITASGCSSVTGTQRVLLISFKSSTMSSFESFPSMPIDSVPSAFVAQNLDGGAQVFGPMKFQGTGSAQVGFGVPSSLSASYNLTLPNSPPTSGMYLMSDGSGQLSWNTPPVGGSGTVTSIATGVGLQGGPITSSGTIQLATIPNNYLLANTSGITSQPTATTLSTIFNSTYTGPSGAILYNHSGTWVTTPAPIAGNSLTFDGSNVVWSTPTAPALTGDATTSGNVITLNPSGVTAGTYSKVTVNSKGLLTGGAILAPADIPWAITNSLTPGAKIIGTSDANTLTLAANGLTGLTLATSGNVGIGMGITPSSTLTVAGPLALLPPSTITTSSYSMTATDSSLIFNVTSACSVTFLPASAYPGRILHIKSIGTGAINSSSSNVVPLSSATPGTSLLTGSGKWAMLQSDGINWIVMASN